MPALRTTLQRVLSTPPPPSLQTLPESTLALRHALLFLYGAFPANSRHPNPNPNPNPNPDPHPTPLGKHLAFELERHASAEVLHACGLSGLPPLLAGAGWGAGLTLGALLLRAVLVGLSAWMPSSILGDAAAAAWGMRRALGDAIFGRWLEEALACEDTPRVGMGAEQKQAYAQQLLAATNWSNFKAVLKQLCGGKKKQK